MNHHFTLIIPTRERAQTLEYALKTCTAQDYDNFEILVCDNASRDQTRDVVAATDDPRIRYINPGKRLSMMENFEFAFSHAKNGYVYSMGDDDGLARNALMRVNEILNQTPTDAVVSDFAHYMWPNVQGPAAGQLVVPRGNGYSERDPRQDLHEVLYRRRPFNHLPCIYYGFVHAELLARLRKMHGRLFLTNIVDLFSAVALSLAMPRYVFSYEPLALNGTSKRSNGAAFMQISSDSSEKERWHQENTSTSIAPFSTTGSIKMMLAEACYALEKYTSPLQPLISYDMSKLLSQAHLDVHLYAKSNIDPQLIESICTQLGHPGLKPSSWARLVALIELYRYRIPRFLTCDIVDATAMGVQDIDAAALLLAQRKNAPPSRVFDRLHLLAQRFQAVR